MKCSYSEHALQRMTERNISEEIIEASINNPDSAKAEHGLIIYQKVWYRTDKEAVIFSESTNNRSEERFLIRVFLNELNIPPTVVTVYKTSKLDKYL